MVVSTVCVGGPKGMVGGTIFEMWLGGSVILGTAILAGSSSLFRWAYFDDRQNHLRDVAGKPMIPYGLIPNTT